MSSLLGKRVRFRNNTGQAYTVVKENAAEGLVWLDRPRYASGPYLRGNLEVVSDRKVTGIERRVDELDEELAEKVATTV